MAPNSPSDLTPEIQPLSPTSSATPTPPKKVSQAEESPKSKEVQPPEEGVKELPAIKSPKAKKAKAPEEWTPTVIKDNPNHITIK